MIYVDVDALKNEYSDDVELAQITFVLLSMKEKINDHPHFFISLNSSSVYG